MSDMPERIFGTIYKGEVRTGNLEDAERAQRLGGCVIHEYRRVTPEYTALMERVRGALEQVERQCMVMVDTGDGEDYCEVCVICGEDAGNHAELCICTLSTDALAALDKMGVK